MTTKGRNMRRAILATCAFVLAFASVATGDTAERAAYKEQVEPICKKNQEASKSTLTGVEKLVKNSNPPKDSKLKQAGLRFAKAATALEKAQKQLAGVAQPPEDAAKLGKWLKGISEEVTLMKKIAKELKSNTPKGKRQGSADVVKLKSNAKSTNNLVLIYQFKYCKIDPSKYH